MDQTLIKLEDITMLKVFSRVVLALLPWEIIFGFILELAEKMIAEWFATKIFTKKAKYFVMGIYVLAEGWGEELVADTRTTLDDTTLQSLLDLCVSSATQQQFKLPDVPELLNGGNKFSRS
jgi:uncharacterized membrane protein YczE